MDLKIFGIALMPLIMALVELFKRAGLPVRFAPYVAGLLAAAGFFLSQYVEWNPAIAPQVEFWLNVLIIFLGASGLYAVGKFGKEQLTRE